ncbi:Tubulin-folding cofactor D [Taphrina deformans PYCC 5710]|uniref:Tubulin-folding cofactor D n=1 Tax=Taphrina deformans (strain PYCC 5710 / ATCC 11124 / CBS 356.35 / IMI 108563 / JCM 9778 / NBRC 8474) TaxID=1097556 RepID=R4XFA5_TAPDE|nr:Tubulin-folding cofactor D [Taphrina deformans PYCC 5710]|eukprot:CCG82037.1 Tubulin-folding cofactor D [Taphrina deformans PYCC 5710]
MTTFDKYTSEHESKHIPIVDQILHIGEMFMGSLNRWQRNSTNYRTGLLTCLSELYKVGNRDVLLFHAQSAVQTLREIGSTVELAENTLLRKLRTKFAQRIALALLTPNSASWRYRNNPKSLDSDASNTSDDDPSDPPEEVEDILGLLLESLNDKDTIVRYSAAKGIGRLAVRLPINYAEEVVDAVIQSLEIGSATTGMPGQRLQIGDSALETTWHGACLALAELCRSGALMPSCLSRMFPLVFLALRFDIKKGSHSIGTSVRDAACYTMWSILRCYRTDLLQPFGSAIANALIVVALFDREISVRRAASAAYQEGVGRHSEDVFPNGLAILLLADFVAVGQRRSSFLEVAPSVFLYPAYQDSILAHLTTTSCVHWDRDIRELAGTALKLIVLSGLMRDSDFLAALHNTIKSLIDQQHSLDVSARHGSIYALGELCSALRASLYVIEIGHPHFHSCITQLRTIVDNIANHNFRGPSAGLMYSGWCHFIAEFSQLEATRNVKPDEIGLGTQEEAPVNTQRRFYKLALEGLSRKEKDVTQEASDALLQLYSFESSRQEINSTILENSMITSNPAMGGWLVLYGKLDYTGSPDLLFEVVSQTARMTLIIGDKTRDNPDTRRTATGVLRHLIPQLVRLASLGHENIDQSIDFIIRSLESGLLDFSVDARGDVGSWVREAAVHGTCRLFENVEVLSRVPGARDRFVDLLVSVLSQCLGKIDNLRTSTIYAVTTTLKVLLGSEQKFSGMTVFYHLLGTIQPVLGQAAEHLNTGAPSITIFEDLAPLLAIDSLRATLMREYLISGSSGSQSTMTAASSALSSYLDGQDSTFLEKVLVEIERTVASRKDDDRVLIPVLDSTASLFENQIFADVETDLEPLFVTIQNATLNTRTMPKIFAALKCYAALATTRHPVAHRAWKKLSLTLSHKFPRVRVLAAELLYSVLSNSDLETLEETSAVVEALTEVDWALAVEKEKAEIVKAYVLP